METKYTFQFSKLALIAAISIGAFGAGCVTTSATGEDEPDARSGRDSSERDASDTRSDAADTRPDSSPDAADTDTVADVPAEVSDVSPDSDDSTTGCVLPSILCGGRCIDPTTDPAHCGECDNPCGPGRPCEAGVCTCADGLLECGGRCVDVQVNGANCGECDNACEAGRRCAAGDCVCTPGLEECNGVCTDVSRDLANCGDCGVACGVDQICSSGSCLSDCGAQTLCGTECADVTTSNRHCGGCDQACRGDQECLDSDCDCPAGLTDCSGICRDLITDEASCGRCGRECRSDQVCNVGACRCPEGLFECDGVCRSIVDDPANCGACGNICGANSICRESACLCEPGFTSCNGTCVALSSDRLNCGECGVVCAAGTYCAEGSCQEGCPGSLTLCGLDCLDTSSDSNNCGTCGNVCTRGTVCSGGACTCTPDPLEPNDTSAQATVVALGNTQTAVGRTSMLSEVSLCPSDIDTYQFWVPGSGADVIAEMRGDCETQATGARLQLLRVGTEVIASSEGGGLGNCPIMRTRADAAGYYNIVVDSPSGVGSGYWLDIRLDAISELEANDDFAAADGPVSRSTRFFGNVDEGGFFESGDYDYYYMQFRGFTPIVLETSNRDGGCSFDSQLFLYDADGFELAFNDDSGTLCSRIEGVVAPGEYYILVQPYSGGFDYALNLTTTAYQELEPNSDAASANDFGAGSLGIEGVISQVGDVDYYRVAYDAVDPFYAWTSGMGVNCDTDTIVEIYDSAGTLIASDDNSGETSVRGTGSCSEITPSSHPAVSSMTAGTYFVAVRGAGDARGAYLLNVAAY